MQVFQTEGTPPSTGNNVLAIMGCTQNNSKALVKAAAANSSDGTAMVSPER